MCPQFVFEVFMVVLYSSYCRPYTEHSCWILYKDHEFDTFSQYHEEHERVLSISSGPVPIFLPFNIMRIWEWGIPRFWNSKEYQNARILPNIDLTFKLPVKQFSFSWSIAQPNQVYQREFALEWDFLWSLTMMGWKSSWGKDQSFRFWYQSHCVII